MAVPKFTFTTLFLSLLCLHTHDAVSVLELQDALKTSEVDAMVKRVCSKKLEDCLGDEEMESESQRRLLLMQRRYISYETLRRDMVPCEKPGASYYDCHAGQAHPYSRGCEIITRCARGIKDVGT
ncbi:Protein RALF-like 24 [Hibiscus syriacus]|uniref:Protein RALF-like 24 n=1 Tax=Hibiscus syriacus TaxID=106335 RepID=A0A6A3BEU6_HIBSY|nr:protein RALF-like 24 [Hibiscus syriacus]KAE8714525.1 Protein RALF-like 24 [Hibiscus syriacus]